MPKPMPSGRSISKNAADELIARQSPDAEVAYQASANKPPAPPSKSVDTENYKKQQFYCERELLAKTLSLKAKQGYGDLSDIINTALREYHARLDAAD